MSTFNVVLYLSSGLENVVVLIFVKELAIIIISLKDISV